MKNYAPPPPPYYVVPYGGHIDGTWEAFSIEFIDVDAVQVNPSLYT